MQSSKQNPKRLVLFDVDGTILWGGPLWKESFNKAFSSFFPDLHLPEVSFGGKTDLQICREMMAMVGFDEPKIEAMMHKVGEKYIHLALEQVKNRAHEVTPLPGAIELIKELHTHPDVFLGLLTGNIKQGAYTKLSCLGLDTYFPFGVFGDDHWNRYKLPAIALNRIEKQHGLSFSGKQVVIIGDTIHDVGCGKEIQARTIAVGTGKANLDELLSKEPDYYFKDLSATFEVIQAILEEI